MVEDWLRLEALFGRPGPESSLNDEGSTSRCCVDTGAEVSAADSAGSGPDVLDGDLGFAHALGSLYSPDQLGMYNDVRGKVNPIQYRVLCRQPSAGIDTPQLPERPSRNRFSLPASRRAQERVPRADCTLS